MTAFNVAASAITLYDNWPGPIDKLSLPAADSAGNHFTNSTHHNVATAAYAVCTNIGVYDKTSVGWSILIYLRNQADTHATASALGHIGTQFASGEYYDVSNAGDELVPNALPVVYLSVMTDAYYGWFWGGGVPPVSWTPLLTTTSLATKDGVAADIAISVIDVVDPDRAGFDALTTSDNAIGWSTAADA